MAVEWLAGKRAKGTSSERPKIDFKDGFSTDQGWSNVASYHYVDTGNSRYNSYARRSVATNDGYYDLGAGNVSDSAWVMRFNVNINSGSGAGVHAFFGLSSTTAKMYGNTHDKLGLYLYANPSTSLRAIATDNTINNAGNHGTSETVSTGTTYYIELIRDGTTFYYKRYSDSTYSTVSYSESVSAPATITGLRYLKAGSMVQDLSITSDLLSYFDDVKFYNGVTSVPDINLQDGTIFEETDTNKAYIWNASTTTWTQL